jgi:hypothetical protein
MNYLISTSLKGPHYTGLTHFAYLQCIHNNITTLVKINLKTPEMLFEKRGTICSFPARPAGNMAASLPMRRHGTEINLHSTGRIHAAAAAAAAMRQLTLPVATTRRLVS